VSLATKVIVGDFSLGVLAGSLSFGLLLFFGVGATGAVLGRGRAEGPDRRIRRWARSHPWHVAAVPAGAMLVSDFVMRQLLTSEGFFGSLWDGLWRGALVAAVAGVVGTMAAGRDSS
jgi:ABC-type branched-subunit amino acid transport system permease subunit